MSTTGVLEFSLELKSQTVKLGDEMYTVRELDGAERGKYLDSVSSRVKTNAQGKPVGMTTFEGLETSLLKRCLYDKNLVLVPEKDMARWPASTLSHLFDIASDMSGLNEAAKKRMQEDAKND